MSPTEVGRPSQNGSTEHVWHLVVPYSIVFVLAVTGNALVMATLVFNKSMRTVTNIFLLNLAVSDFLLGVFCMPFTLSGVLFREFLFGRVLCKMIPYFQGKNLLTLLTLLIKIRNILFPYGLFSLFITKKKSYKDHRKLSRRLCVQLSIPGIQY